MKNRLMVHLGINQDRYDSGVAVASGGQLLYAANEERFSRKKCQGGFPYRALDAAFEVTGIRPSDVDRICVAGLVTPPLPVRMVPRLHQILFKEDRTGANPCREWLIDYLAFHTGVANASESSILGRTTANLRGIAVRRSLPSALRRASIEFVEHHTAHAAGAHFLSGFDETMCLTADGYGDRLSLTVSRWRGDAGERLSSVPLHHSLGLFYEEVTQALGFIPNRHEGKITGLAAYGDWRRVDVPSPFSCSDGQLRYDGVHGQRAVRWLREHLCARYRREDIASWAQHVLEENILQVARFWLRRTGLSSLVVGGGVFANVRLNQLLHELPEVNRFFVHPNMGDGGLALGAIAVAGGLTSGVFRDAFLGEDLDAEVIASLDSAGLPYERSDDVDAALPELLAGGNLVARYRGRMEWGPRALGNRSVLARSDDLDAVARLNRLLRRSDFMPFAPAVLDEDADAYLLGLNGARGAAEFMTVCFAATDRMKADHPAVVHVDGSVRAQVVRRETNPSFHRLLSAYKALTGAPILLNTSFNIHEEPIVRTPAEAISAFRRAGLDFLALGHCLVSAATAGADFASHQQLVNRLDA
jgi:carbamoyltransferase